MSIDQQAAEWFVRSRGADFDRAAFAAWIDADPAHLAAFNKAEAVWQALEPGAKTGLSRRSVLGSAAILAAAAGTGAWFGIDPITLATADHATGLGEIKTVTLETGDRIDLGARSAIAVQTNAAERRIELLRGEAVFTVAPAGQPFTVVANGVEARALGTVYAVEIGEGVTVSVLESRVTVLSASDARTLAAGEAVVARDGLGPTQDASLREIEGWRAGSLAFQNRTVAQIVARMNRYRPGRVIVTDQALAARRLSGVIPIDRIDDAPAIVAQQLGARLVDLGPVGAVLMSN